MSAAMAAARNAADPDDRIDVYKKQLSQLAEVRTAYNDAAMASGNWHVQTVKNISASEDFTNKVRKQKLGIMELSRAYGQFRKTGGGALGEAIKEQTALRNATATQLTSSLFGKNLTDLHLPKNLGPDLDNTRVKLGMIAQAIGSASTQMVNWGKNTQWAGRQITVGLTMPLGMAAVGVAALALKVDEQLTRIQKVYDTTATSGAAKEAELGSVREASLETATRMAHEYGAAMADTLDVQAQLAATGLNGARLQQATAETVRIATLGEMEYADAIQMTISLQTAFKLNTEELTETFNMFNAVENATSLGIADIAQAIPRAASAMASMGGTAADLTVLMTALKESGVDPAIGANAIKSATATLLTPTNEAIEYFKDKLGIDLPDMVRDAEGDILSLLTNLGVAMRDLNPTEAQAGIGHLFGKYQFDRATALLNNLGDAASGVANQTATSMEIVGTSAEELALSADEEIRRIQQSLSGQFKSAVEGMKAEFVPLGETVLGAITPIIKGITWLIAQFNDLSGFTKNFILIGAAILAIAGPALMIVGIFANLFGNIMKLGAGLANLKSRFRAQSAEEAAAEIMARKATSAFDTEGAAVARLTMQVQALTDAMKESAVASGIMMDETGRIGDRSIVKPRHGDAYYASGSKDDKGNRLDGMPVREEDLARYESIRNIAEDTNTETEKTKRSWKDIAGSISNIAMVALPAFAAFAIDMEGVGGVLLDMGLIGGALVQTGMLDKPINAIKEKVTGVFEEFATGKIQDKIAAGFEAMGTKATAALGVLKDQGVTGAGKKIGNGLKAAGGALLNFGKMALRVFGPIGLIAGAAMLIWKIVEGLDAAEEAQRALVSSGEAWSSALGYTYMQGQLPGMDPENAENASKVVEAQNAMAESSEGLADAMRLAKDEGTLYNAAMKQALNVVTTGGTADQARIAFEASLQMAGADRIEMDQLMVKFNKVDLDDPHAVRTALHDQLNDTFEGLNAFNLDVNNNQDSSWETFTGWFRNAAGGDLSDDARAVGEATGAALAQGLVSAANPGEQAALFDQLSSNMNRTFANLYNNAVSDPEVAAAADGLGISTADQFIQQMEKIQGMVENDETLSAAQQAFWDSLTSGDDIIDTPFLDFKAQYEEMLDTIVQGMVDSGAITQTAGDEIRENINSIADLEVNRIGEGVNAEPLLSIADATQMWAEQSGLAASRGYNLSEAEKLVALNALRARAGLGAAENSAQGFGDVINTATGQVDELAAALSGISVTAEQRVTQLQDTFSGTMNDVYGEADRLLQDHQNDQLDDIRNGSEKRLNALEREGDRMNAEWDRRSKDFDKSQDAQERSFEKHWDSREDALERHYDVQIDRIEAQIEAERKADEDREKMFEREKRRIERLAELANNNIDFNAALNSGDLDEAAKLYNTNEATVQGWALDDQNEAMGDASQQRRESLEKQVENLNKVKDARIEALRQERERERIAFQERQQEAKDLFESQRKAAQDGLKARQDAERQATEDHLRNTQRRQEAERRELAARLRELQAFTPRNEQELNAHIGRVEGLYSEYGLELRTQGNNWAGYIGTSLHQNMRTATTKLQNDLNWQAIGKVITDRMADGMGVTAGQMEFFIRNGRFPNMGMLTGIFDKALAITQGINLSRHAGGDIGGPGFSQKDRAGVPRSASPFPSEFTTLLKRGEFVVNEKSTRKNRGLLEAINSGLEIGGPGGLAGIGASALAGRTLMFAETVSRGMMQHAAASILEAYQGAGATGGLLDSEAFRGAGGFSGPSGGTSQTERMWNTIKQHFPRAKLNDALRPGASDMHGRGKAIDIGLQGVPGGAGNSYMAAMNAWIHDNIPNVYELIYTGLGDNRPDLKRGRPLNYGAATNAAHTNHVHWAMEAFHKGGFASLLPQLKAGAFTLSEGLANLHPGEAVLTKPLTDDFKQSVANSNESSYNVNINFNGPVNTQIDFERGVQAALEKAESKRGRSRVVKR